MSAHAVALAETAFFPTGGGQPHAIRVLEAKSKGKANKRIRIAVEEA